MEPVININYPYNRFGHAFVQLSFAGGLLFGGAVQQSNNYLITADTFLYQYSTLKWIKVNNQGIIPSPRAAHSMVVAQHFMFLFGGSSGNGQLVQQALFFTDITTITSEAVFWNIIKNKGISPQKRYGHTLSYLKPYIIIFGGHSNSSILNDTWIMHINNQQWIRVETQIKPSPRVYHSITQCQSGSASGMLVLFGGRGQDGQSLSDIWGLRKHRDDKIGWIRAPYQQNKSPQPRQQHSCIFIGSLLILIGGRNSYKTSEVLPIQCYDVQNSEFGVFGYFDRIKHVCFRINQQIFVIGGSKRDNSLEEGFFRINLTNMLISNQNFYKYVLLEISNKQDSFSISNEQHRKYQQSERRGSEEIKNIQKIDLQKKSNIQYKQNCRLNQQIVYAKNQVISKLHINHLLDQSKRIKKYNKHQYKKNQEISQIASKMIEFFMIQNTIIYNEEIKLNILKIIQFTARQSFQEPILLHIKKPLKIFGDIYGQLSQLKRWFSQFESPTNDQNGDIQYNNYLFLGNYIDKGFQSIQTLIILCSLKCKYPQNIFLLRGAHENRQINIYMGFAEQCRIKFNQNIQQNDSFFNKFNSLFQNLSLAALINNQYLCTHSQINPDYNYFQLFQKIQKPITFNLHNNLHNNFLQTIFFNNFKKYFTINNKQQVLLFIFSIINIYNQLVHFVITTMKTIFQWIFPQLVQNIYLLLQQLLQPFQLWLDTTNLQIWINVTKDIIAASRIYNMARPVKLQSIRVILSSRK